MILRTYLTDPGDWDQVVLNIKANIENLPGPTRTLYETRTPAKLRARCRDKFSMLLKGKNKFNDPDLQ